MGKLDKETQIKKVEDFAQGIQRTWLGSVLFSFVPLAIRKAQRRDS